MIWVVATSWHGSTSEIGDTIAEVLRRAGPKVERKDPEELDGLERAEAIVLGSAIYGGRWLEPARRLLSEQADVLAAPGLALQHRTVGRPARAGGSRATGAGRGCDGDRGARAPNRHWPA